MRRLGGRLLGAYLRFCLFTARVRVEMPEAAVPHLFGRDGERAIVAFWHESLPLITALWFHARRRSRTLRMTVLISRHRDGRMIAGMVERWGVETVAGSSAKVKSGVRDDKGGTAALRVLLERLGRGGLVGITPDGPRGPRRVFAPGVLRLAAMSGVPVVVAAAACSPARRMRSWDRMWLPVPFGRIAICCSEPIAVPRRGWEDQAAVVEAAMRAMESRAGMGA